LSGSRSTMPMSASACWGVKARGHRDLATVVSHLETFRLGSRSPPGGIVGCVPPQPYSQPTIPSFVQNRQLPCRHLSTTPTAIRTGVRQMAGVDQNRSYRVQSAGGSIRPNGDI
jgi:hypothetical protein